MQWCLGLHIKIQTETLFLNDLYTKGCGILVLCLPLFLIYDNLTLKCLFLNHPLGNILKLLNAYRVVYDLHNVERKQFLF